MPALMKTPIECRPNNRRVYLVQQSRTAYNVRNAPVISEQHTVMSRSRNKGLQPGWWMKYDLK